tara:strand:+ start:192 stop:407 length:216 start_codon:yes stop_codon:yes gene_type:complete
MKTKTLERLICGALLGGFCFFFGVFYTYYKIDQRLWNEEILKARDIETRYINYPKQRNYKSEDIKRIIYGN